MSLREMMNASMEDIHSQASPDLCICWNDQCVPDPSCLHYIISRYSACLSGRGCYQSRTHSEDERGINTQALEPCSYSQRWPVSFQPKSWHTWFMIVILVYAWKSWRSARAQSSLFVVAFEKLTWMKSQNKYVKLAKKKRKKKKVFWLSN